jgi:hypothetical protein
MTAQIIEVLIIFSAAVVSGYIGSYIATLLHR